MAERKYKVSTLQKRLDRYKEQLYEETLRPQGNWGDGMRLAKLRPITKWERLKDKVAETVSRMSQVPEQEITDISVLKMGTTNCSVLFSYRGKQYH